MRHPFPHPEPLVSQFNPSTTVPPLWPLAPPLPSRCPYPCPLSVLLPVPLPIPLSLLLPVPLSMPFPLPSPSPCSHPPFFPTTLPPNSPNTSLSLPPPPALPSYTRNFPAASLGTTTIAPVVGTVANPPSAKSVASANAATTVLTVSVNGGRRAAIVTAQGMRRSRAGRKL